MTVGDVVLKHGARKIRMLYDGAVIAGFAGAVADALTLFSKFESQLKTSDGNLRKASVELAKEWRTDRYLRRLEAQLIVGDGESLLVLSGEGDVIEPDDGIAAIGSGAPYATAAAKALMAHTDLPRARSWSRRWRSPLSCASSLTTDSRSIRSKARPADRQPKMPSRRGN